MLGECLADRVAEDRGLETGSRGAVLGGVTAVFEMPNTEPTTTSAAALADKVRRAQHRMHCDFAFYVGATRENTRELAALERLPGACGVSGESSACALAAWLKYSKARTSS